MVAKEIKYMEQKTSLPKLDFTICSQSKHDFRKTRLKLEVKSDQMRGTGTDEKKTKKRD
jgi:hypothetical protein